MSKSYKCLVIAVFLLTVIVCSTIMVSADYFNCAWQQVITVENSGSSTETNARIQFTMNPLNLISLGMLKPSTDDSYLQDGAVTLYHVATVLSGTNSTWLGNVTSIGAYSSKSLTLFYGEGSPSARDQKWLGDYSDVTWADDSVTLDLSQDFELSTDITLYTAPTSGTAHIISKMGSYSLDLTTTPEYVFTVWTGTAAAVTASGGTPNGVGTYTNLPIASSGTTPHWSLVSDGSDATFVGGTPGATAQDTYITTVADGAVISSSTVFYRIGFNGGTGVATAIPILYSSQTGTIVGTPQAVPSSFTTYSEALAWTGGSDVEVGLRLLSTSGSPPLCSEAWVTCNWVGPGSSTAISLAATTGTELQVSAWYDGANMHLANGITTTSSGTLTANCFVNRDPLYTLMAHAAFDNLEIAVP